jgi:IS30 family transposase
MSHYTQLTQEERYQISVLKTAGHSQVDIAKVIGRHKSTVSRELSRNRELRGYRPKQANTFAENRRQDKSAPRVPPESWARV